MKELLFSTPWWLPTLIICVGITLFIYGNKRVDATLRNVGLVVVALEIVLMLVSYFVDTDVEKVVARTKQLVAAVSDRDWKRFGSLLDKQTHFYIYHNRDDVVSGAAATADRVAFKTAHVTSLDAKQTDTLITVDLTVLSEQEMPPYPVTSSWRLTWQQSADGWFLNEITVLPNQSVKPDQVMSRLVPPQK